MTPGDSIGFGVVGLGVGERHLNAVINNSNCSLKAVHDLDSSRATGVVAGIAGVRVVHGFQEMLDDPEIDAVVIASHDDDHYYQVVSALEAGKHVFVEKPICRSLDELATIKERLVEASGSHVLWSNLILRAAPMNQWLREEIRSGALGQVYAFDGDYLYGRLGKITAGWRSTVENYSVVAGGAIHLVDLLLWLTGERPVAVAASSNGICTEGTAFQYDDFVAATLEFDSGLVARVTANFGCVHAHQHVVRLFGTQGTFLYDDRGARLHMSRDPDVGAEGIGLAPLAMDKGDLVAEFVAEIVSGPVGGGNPQSFLDAVSVCVAIDAAQQSRRTEEVVYL